MTLTEKAIGVCFRRWAMAKECEARCVRLGLNVSAWEQRGAARDIARHAVWVAWKRRYPNF